MSDETTPKAGVTVGQVAQNAAPTDVVMEDQTAEGDVVDITDLTPASDDAFITRLAEGLSDPGDDTEAPSSFQMPEEILQIEEGKMVLTAKSARCVRRAFFTRAQRKEKPNLLCTCEKDDPTCVATWIQFRFPSKWDTRTDTFVGRMKVADDLRGRLALMKEYEVAMDGAPEEKFEAGISRLKAML